MNSIVMTIALIKKTNLLDIAAGFPIQKNSLIVPDFEFNQKFRELRILVNHQFVEKLSATYLIFTKTSLLRFIHVKTI